MLEHFWEYQDRYELKVAPIFISHRWNKKFVSLCLLGNQ